ncbi:MAG: hypothetical protein H6Q90_217 [Deltaproteobacteria bacterium]|nr:hypothetical protein [Deltaproteobacteria bacterium]
MTRATKLLAGTTAVAIASSLWLYFDNRALRAELARPEVVAAAEQPVAPAPKPDAWLDARPKEPRSGTITPAPVPELPKENRMDRRARRTDELASQFGRLDGETEDEYRARIMPLLKLGLALPRERVAEMRRLAEDKAKVTAEQSAKLDKAFDKIYDDVLAYTNKAITDGQLSPYERNVAGWLDYAGGLGGILTDANGQIGHILEPGQMKAMYDAGFEWGEYLGLSAPWEKLTPPPPRGK